MPKFIKDSLPYVLICPALLILIGIVYLFALGVYQSLTNITLYSPKFSFIGFGNYIRIFRDLKFWESVNHTVLYTILSVGIALLLGIGVGLLINYLDNRFLRAILPLPLMVMPVAAALMWKIMMNPSYGILNYLLNCIGLRGLLWLASTETALISVVLIDVWIYTPFVALITLAALQRIPKDLIEVAKIDGAGSWHLFSRVILPLISPSLIIAILFKGLFSLREFSLIYTTTQGGPVNSTMTLHINAYYEIIKYMRLGKGMAYLVVLWAMCFIASFLLVKLWIRRSEAIR